MCIRDRFALGTEHFFESFKFRSARERSEYQQESDFFEAETVFLYAVSDNIFNVVAPVKELSVDRDLVARRCV